MAISVKLAPAIWRSMWNRVASRIGRRPCQHDLTTRIDGCGKTLRRTRDGRWWPGNGQGHAGLTGYTADLEYEGRLPPYCRSAGNDGVDLGRIHSRFPALILHKAVAPCAPQSEP